MNVRQIAKTLENRKTKLDPHFFKVASLMLREWASDDVDGIPKKA